MRLTRSEFQALKAKTAAKRERRADNAAFQAKMAGKPRKVSRKGLAAKLDDVFSLFIRARDIRANDGKCRICSVRPIECAYHIVPKMYGKVFRWLEADVVGACHGCNGGERNWRLLYREKHIAIFGQEFYDALWSRRKEAVKYSSADLQAMIKKFQEGLNP